MNLTETRGVRAGCIFPDCDGDLDARSTVPSSAGCATLQSRVHTGFASSAAQDGIANLLKPGA
jgi:hypothetical protein